LGCLQTWHLCMKALPGFICASNLAFKRRLVVQMRQGMMGMSFEDTFDQVVCSKSGNLLQKESVASVAVKKSCQPHSAISKAMVVSAAKGWWQFRALLETTRIRMTHWPTPVSSLNTALLLQNESSNPTSDGSQLRSSHNLKAALRSPSLCINTALLLGVMPTQVVSCSS